MGQYSLVLGGEGGGGGGGKDIIRGTIFTMTPVTWFHGRVLVATVSLEFRLVKKQ